jgi:flagellar protein FlgJ
MDPAASIAKMQIAATRTPKIDGEAGKKMDPAAARKAAEDVEAFFLTMMIESMYAGIKTDGMFGGGQGENVFRSLLFQEYGKATARTGSYGIADAIQREMLALQEVQQ